MPVVKTPQADLRRRYPRYQQIGLALSLGLVIVAFTVPTEPSAPEVVVAAPTEPWVPIDIPPTVETPPPPQPPAPPPPVEVIDEKEVESLWDDFEIDPGAELPLSNTPPTTPTVELPTEAAPPPPTRDIEDQDEGWIDFAEVQPELIGGLAALQARVEYPEMARRIGIEGRVTVQFIVDERGNVVDPVAIVCPNDLLCEAAIEAVQESRFTPGQQRGRPVRVRFAVPVTFRLR